MVQTASDSKKKKIPILRHILLVVISVVIGVNVYVWNAKSLTGDTLPMPFGYGFAVILTGSMEPTLQVNDLVVIHRQEVYEEGEIVVYQSGGEQIIHRIISVNDGQVLTKGDANPSPDAPVDPAQIKGVLVLHIPYVGAMVRGLKHPVGIAAVLTAAVVLLELSYKREQEEKDDTQERIKEEIRRLKQEIEEDR